MTRLNWLFGVSAAVGLVGACGFTSACSSDSGAGTTPVNHAGASGAATAGSGGASAGAGGSSAGSSGASTGGSSGSVASAGSAGAAPLQTPTLLTSVPACGNMSLAVANGALYFTNSAGGKVSSVPIAGGTVTDVATAQKAPYAIAVDAAGTVYWSNTSDATGADNTLMMKTTAGMPAVITAVDQKTAPMGKTNKVIRFTLDGKGSLFYGSHDDLNKVATSAGSTPTKLGTFDGSPTAIILSPAAPAATTRIFATLGIDNAVQWRSPDPTTSGCIDPVSRPLPVTGETPAQAMARINGSGCAFSESIGSLLVDSMTLSGTFVVFADGSNIYTADTTVPATMQVTRSLITVTDDFDPISGLTSTASTVYFGESSQGIIEKAPLPATYPTKQVSPVILVNDTTKQISPSAFVTDASNVYWRTGSAATDACDIYKLPL